MSSIFLCKKADIPANGFKVFEVANGKVLVANSEGALYAYDGTCPHQEVCLSEGMYDGRVFTCHQHLWQWDITTGEPQGLAEGPLVGKEIQEISEEVYLIQKD
jgi:toluene monooxygenase system ferredoxin subunit